MVDVSAESMVGGTTFHRRVIQREISRVLVLNLSGKPSGAQALHRISLPLTEPSLLSRGTLYNRVGVVKRHFERPSGKTAAFEQGRLRF
jgi:hypothetical protein